MLRDRAALSMESVRPRPERRYVVQLDTTKTVLQNFAPPKERTFVRATPVRGQMISETALLAVESALDDISGFGQTEVAHQLYTSIPVENREHYRVPRVGHYGIFSGTRWRELIHPRLREFIRDER